MFFLVIIGCLCVNVQRLTAVGFIRAVLAVERPVTALPVGDAVWGPATQELTPAAAARGGWGSRGLGGYWSQEECQRGDSYFLFTYIYIYMFCRTRP